MTIADVHCHFCSAGFFATLGRDAGIEADPAVAVPKRLGWDPPGTDETLADRWITELDRYSIARAMIIASVPGDEDSVARAVAAHPARLVGAFMFDPTVPGAEARLERALGELKLSTVCLFPAMHQVDPAGPVAARVFAAAQRHRRAVFVHCGLLSIGVRKMLGLPSHFDLRLGNPLAVAAAAVKYPEIPVIIPHFGAGLFHETLMAAAAAPNILVDTSSSNGWIAFHPRLALRDVWERAIGVMGPHRLLFGTDSSFFPRGWQHALREAQLAVMDALDLGTEARTLILGANFARIFPEILA